MGRYLKILIALVFTVAPVSAFAADTQDIWVMGSGPVVVDVFYAINMMVSDGMYSKIFRLLAITSVLVMAVAAVPANKIKPDQFLLFLFSLLILETVIFHGKVDILVRDPLNESVIQPWDPLVTDVPYGVAIPAIFVTSFGEGLTQLVEKYMVQAGFPDSLTLSTSNRFNILGQIMNDMSEIRVTDPQLRASMGNFSKDCILPRLYMGQLNSRDLRTTNDLWAYVQDSNEGRLTNYLPRCSSPSQPGDSPVCSSIPAPAAGEQDARFAGQVVSCKNAWEYIGQDIEIVAPGLVGGSGNAWNYTDVYSYMDDAIFEAATWLGDSSVSSGTDIMKRTAVMKTFMTDTSSLDPESGNLAYNVAIGEAKEAQIAQWRIAAEVFNQTIGYMFIVLQVFCFACAPLIILLAVIPGMGKRTVGAYIVILLWIGTWQPLLSIVNYLAAGFLKYQVQQLMIDGVSMNNMGQISTFTNNVMMATNFMGTMVPMISLGMLKGSAMAFTQFTADAAAPAHANRAAQSAAAGNVDIENKRMNTMQANSMQMAHSLTAGEAGADFHNSPGAITSHQNIGGHDVSMAGAKAMQNVGLGSTATVKRAGGEVDAAGKTLNSGTSVDRANATSRGTGNVQGINDTEGLTTNVAADRGAADKLSSQQSFDNAFQTAGRAGAGGGGAARVYGKGQIGLGPGGAANAAAELTDAAGGGYPQQSNSSGSPPGSPRRGGGGKGALIAGATALTGLAALGFASRAAASDVADESGGSNVSPDQFRAASGSVVNDDLMDRLSKDPMTANLSRDEVGALVSKMSANTYQRAQDMGGVTPDNLTNASVAQGGDMVNGINDGLKGTDLNAGDVGAMALAGMAGTAIPQMSGSGGGSLPPPSTGGALPGTGGTPGKDADFKKPSTGQKIANGAGRAMRTLGKVLGPSYVAAGAEMSSDWKTGVDGSTTETGGVKTNSSDGSEYQESLRKGFQAADQTQESHRQEETVTTDRRTGVSDNNARGEGARNEHAYTRSGDLSRTAGRQTSWAEPPGQGAAHNLMSSGLEQKAGVEGMMMQAMYGGAATGSWGRQHLLDQEGTGNDILQQHTDTTKEAGDHVDTAQAEAEKGRKRLEAEMNAEESKARKKIDVQEDTNDTQRADRITEAGVKPAVKDSIEGADGQLDTAQASQQDDRAKQIYDTAQTEASVDRVMFAGEQGARTLGTGRLSDALPTGAALDKVMDLANNFKDDRLAPSFSDSHEGQVLETSGGVSSEFTGVSLESKAIDQGDTARETGVMPVMRSTFADPRDADGKDIAEMNTVMLDDGKLMPADQESAQLADNIRAAGGEMPSSFADPGKDSTYSAMRLPELNDADNYNTSARAYATTPSNVNVDQSGPGPAASVDGAGGVSTTSAVFENPREDFVSSGGSYSYRDEGGNVQQMEFQPSQNDPQMMVPANQETADAMDNLSLNAAANLPPEIARPDLAGYGSFEELRQADEDGTYVNTTQVGERLGAATDMDAALERDGDRNPGFGNRK